MLSVGRCGVARLQMKFGHMDGMHCIIDGTSILVKIKSVALCNCQTVYIQFIRISSGIVVLPDDGAQASKHVGNMHKIYVCNRYFAFIWC